VASKPLALPTFSQAERFAQLIGVNTPEAWENYIAGKTREELFQQVLSKINSRVMQIAMED